MKPCTIRLAGIVLLAIAAPCLAQPPGLTIPEATAESRLTESLILYEAGDFKGSLHSAREALRLLDQNSAIAYNNICTAHIQLEEHDLAVVACRKALERYPEYERAMNNLGWIYSVMAERDPSVDAYLNLSEVRYLQGAFAESIAAAERALELDPANAIAFNNLCAAHAASKRWPEARVECEKALDIDPDYERAKNNLAWAVAEDAGVSE